MNILDPNITPIPSLQPGDRVYVARPGPPAQDCTIDAESLEEQFSGASKLVNVLSYSSNRTLDVDDDLAAYIRITDEATVTLPDGFPTGWQALIVNATDADTVDLDAATTLVVPSGFEPEIQNRRSVTVVHVGSDVWEAHGALVETP